MRRHRTVVTRETEKAATRLSQALGESFYLVGGTAVALQLGHRVSLDLDLFSKANDLNQRNRSRILESLRASGDLEILESMDGTLHLRVENTAVSLFHYAYPLICPTVTMWAGLPIADLRDISAMKLSAVIGRGARKDFIDLFFISKEIGLASILESGEKHYADHPNFLLQAARGLTYFADAEKEPMPRMKKSIQWPKIKRYFELEVPSLLRQKLREATIK